MSVLGIDLGSSRCKAVAFTPAGKMLAQAACEYAPEHPQPGWVEMAPEVFWDACVACIRTVAAQVNEDPIEALAISSHGETVIPLDHTGEAVGPAMMNADNRATDETAWLVSSLGDASIYRITGSPAHAMFALNKILWMQRHAPDIYEHTDRFVSVGDYLVRRMGFPPYTDPSLASRTMAFDIHRRAWSTEILGAAGLSEEQLSIIHPAGTPVGRLPRTIAATLGVPAGTLVALAGHDQPCGALGAGGAKAGHVSDSAGTYECLAVVSTQPYNTPTARESALNSYCHVVEGHYVTLAFFPAGLAVRWFVEQFCAQDVADASEAHRSLYGYLDTQIAALGDTPTGICMMPHLVGACTPNWDVRATGVICGVTPGTTRHHLYKALHEGIACELALNVEALERIVGPFDCLRIHGGNAQTPFAAQLRADLTGKTVDVLDSTEVVCQGAAMLAGIAAGVYTDADDAVRHVSIASTYAPNPATTQRYSRQSRQYRLLFPALAEVRAIIE